MHFPAELQLHTRLPFGLCSRAACPPTWPAPPQVITASGFELARVTLVDGTGRSLLDELVLPGGPVLDHNTKYSGEGIGRGQEGGEGQGGGQQGGACGSICSRHIE